MEQEPAKPRGPREVMVEMLPEEKRSLVLRAKQLNDRINVLQLNKEKTKICAAIDSYKMRKVDELRRYANEHYEQRHLQKVPALQAIRGGSLELPWSETPTGLIAYVEGVVEQMLVEIDVMVTAAEAE